MFRDKEFGRDIHLTIGGTFFKNLDMGSVQGFSIDHDVIFFMEHGFGKDHSFKGWGLVFPNIRCAHKGHGSPICCVEFSTLEEDAAGREGRTGQVVLRVKRRLKFLVLV